MVLQAEHTEHPDMQGKFVRPEKIPISGKREKS